jgi:hypothetical protein
LGENLSNTRPDAPFYTKGISQTEEGEDMTKSEARTALSVFNSLREQQQRLVKLTDMAVERDEYYAPDGRYEDLQGLADQIGKLLDDYSHREHDAKLALDLPV